MLELNDNPLLSIIPSCQRLIVVLRFGVTLLCLGTDRQQYLPYQLKS
jgi:hypothetical protein